MSADDYRNIDVIEKAMSILQDCLVILIHTIQILLKYFQLSLKRHNTISFKLFASLYVLFACYFAVLLSNNIVLFKTSWKDMAQSLVFDLICKNFIVVLIKQNNGCYLGLRLKSQMINFPFSLTKCTKYGTNY